MHPVFAEYLESLMPNPSDTDERDFLADMRAIWAPKNPLEAAQSSLLDAIRHLEVAEAGMDSAQRFSSIAPIKLALENQMRALALMGEI